MADSGSGVKQFSGEMGQATSEVVKDVKDEVGQMIEQGVQSIAGKQLTPQQIQQKQIEDQKKLTEARRKIKWYQDIAAAQKGVREKEQQKQLRQEEEQEKLHKIQEEESKKKIIISPAKKTPQFPGQAPIREDIALSRPELKAGHGKGG